MGTASLVWERVKLRQVVFSLIQEMRFVAEWLSSVLW